VAAREGVSLGSAVERAVRASSPSHPSVAAVDAGS